MADPFYVSVPNVPGVPPVIFSDPVVDIGTLLTSSIDSVGIGNEVWGIYSGGINVITADIVTGFEYQWESTLANYPVESGRLETYDSVIQPYEAKVRFSSGIDSANRSNLLASIEAIAGDLQTYDVVTPEKVYLNANVTRYSYQRTNESGVGLLTVDVYLQEVRIATSSDGMSNTAQPSGADPTNLGTVQAEPATNAQITAAGGTPITTPQPSLVGGVGGISTPNPAAAGGIGSA